jgi:hypothetical protein
MSVRRVPSRLLKRRWMALFAMLALAGCELKGKALTNWTVPGSAHEPRLVWNGTHFVAAVLWVFPGAKGELELLEYDANGTVVASVTPASASMQITEYNDRYLFSELVWNPDNQQYALAYYQRESKAIWLLRLDSKLKQLSYVRLDFRPSSHGYEIFTDIMKDLSLVWNTARKEYALSYRTSGCSDCHNQPEGHVMADVFLQRITANGVLLEPPGGRRVVECGMVACVKTSLAFDSETGNYAVAYFKGLDGMLAMLQPNLAVQERLVFPNVNSVAQGSIRVVHDPISNDFLVAAQSPVGIHTRVVKPSGLMATPTYRAFPVELSKLSVFSVGNVGFLGPHRYLICASDGRVHCWGATDTQQLSPELLRATDPSVKQMEPFIVAGGVTGQMTSAPFLAWIQNGQVYSGPFP